MGQQYIAVQPNISFIYLFNVFTNIIYLLYNSIV